MNPAGTQLPRSPASRLRSRQRGFTLTELMAVVVIMGILATLAMVGYRKYIDSARSSEAIHMVSSIKAAQEAYRAETLSYLDVSAGNLANYYPRATPGPEKVQWGAGTDALANRWRVLNPTTDGAVMFVYATTAGPPGAVDSTGLAPAYAGTSFPAAVEPWYIVQAAGDINGDGILSFYVATSFSNEVQWVREGQ